MAVSFHPAALPAMALALCLCAVPSVRADALTENFDHGLPPGWVGNNLSFPPGTQGWFQGNDAVFGAHQGASDAYLATNFAVGEDVSTLSNWLILPTSTYQNGDTLSFYTRTTTASLWPDRLELRFSSVGGTDVGSSDTSVGTFTTLLISVNPNEALFGYPEEWTRYSATLSGLSGAVSGAFAFRYTVTDGGPLGANSNYIGIDTVQITAVPEPEAWLTMGAGLGLLAAARRRRLGATSNRTAHS